MLTWYFEMINIDIQIKKNSLHFIHKNKNKKVEIPFVKEYF